MHQSLRPKIIGEDRTGGAVFNVFVSKGFQLAFRMAGRHAAIIFCASAGRSGATKFA
jgi:hypothetical protein